MNEQLQQQLAILLDKTINGIDASVGFMQAQLPEVVEQLLMWYMVKGFVVSATGLAFFIAFVVLAKKAAGADYSNRESDNYWVDGHGQLSIVGLCTMMISGFSGVIGLITFLSKFLEPVQILIAPKIWLIEYAADLAK